MINPIRMFISAACVLALGLIAVPGQTRGIAAQAGSAQNPSDDTCWTNTYGAMFNSCSAGAGAKELDIVLPAESAFSYSVRVGVYGNALSGGNGLVQCQALTVNTDGTSYSSSSVASASGAGSRTNQDLPGGGPWSISTPTNGSMFVACWVDNSSGVNSVRYS